MRNAFAVLVSLCIGVVAGFIVPTSVPEHVKKKPKVEKNNTLEIISRTTASKLAALPYNRNYIDEKDLYEHAAVKQNNQSERAFIYINQKFKKPMRNKIIKKIEKSESIARTLVPPREINAAQTPCPTGFFISANSNSYFQGYDLSDKQIQEIPSFLSANNLLKCNFILNRGKNYKDTEKIKTQVLTPNRPDDRREYFELLKPPILRPVNRVNNKVKYESKQQNVSPSISPTMLPYKDNFMKKYNLKTPNGPKVKVAAEHQDKMRTNYGFDRPYVYKAGQTRRSNHPIFTSKDFLDKSGDGNFDEEFLNEDDSHRIYENNREEDKLLDKYLKDTLEEQISNNDKANSNYECNYRDCILKSSPRQYTNNGLPIKPECKCGRWLNNINEANNAFVTRDRSVREEAKRNDPIPTSSEISYFEELLADDSNVDKIDNDIIRPPKTTTKLINNL